MKLAIDEIDITIIALKITKHLALLGIQIKDYDNKVDMYERLIIKMEDYHRQAMKNEDR